jgi:hypothetical protein
MSDDDKHDSGSPPAKPARSSDLFKYVAEEPWQPSQLQSHHAIHNMRGQPGLTLQHPTFVQTLPQDHPGVQGGASIVFSAGCVGRASVRAELKTDEGDISFSRTPDGFVIASAKLPTLKSKGGSIPMVTVEQIVNRLVGTQDGPPPRIARAPAARLVHCLDSFLTRPAFERMVAPFVAQEQEAFYEALAQKHRGQAVWIVVRMYLLIGYNVIAAMVASVIRLVRRAG